MLKKNLKYIHCTNKKKYPTKSYTRALAVAVWGALTKAADPDSGVLVESGSRSGFENMVRSISGIQNLVRSEAVLNIRILNLSESNFSNSISYFDHSRSTVLLYQLH